MKESDFWKLIKVSLHRIAPYMHLTRIENVGGGGVADVNFCIGGVEGWIELKVAKGRRVVFQPSQIAWISQHIECGGRVFILVRKGDEVALYMGSDALSLHQKKDVAPVFSTSKPFDWVSLKNMLVSCSSSFRVTESKDD